MERWPYPNVPVYVVCPRMGRDAARPCIGTICYLSVPNWKKLEKDTPMTRVEHTRASAPVPHVDSEPADVEPSGMAMSDTTGNTSQDSLINLLHLDMAHIQPRTDSHRDT